MRAIVVSATASGGGKTTLTLGLMACLSQRGEKVQAFKCGPDYIDPTYHQQVTGRPSYNLPAWMMDSETLKALFYYRAKSSSIAVIEGVMGYFDGHDVHTIEGSTAEVAHLLDVPVLLIVNGGKMALTAAAIVGGLAAFHKPSLIKGVLFNQVNSEKHYALLKEAVETHTGIPCLGYVPHLPEIFLESRHLGLLQAEEVLDLEEKMKRLTDVMMQTVDFDKLLTLAQTSEKSVDESIVFPWNDLKEAIDQHGGLKIAVAKDQAFSFYYEENLQVLKSIGAELLVFSPIEDEKLPPCDAIYLGGGYPEVFAKALSENTSMRQSIFEALESGCSAYAECGGLMYLTESIRTLDQKTYEMVGFLKGHCEMTERLQQFGHVNAIWERGRGEKPIAYKGHSFHRSVYHSKEMKRVIEVEKKGLNWSCGYTQKNLIATYIHQHFHSEPEFLREMIKNWLLNKK